MNKLEKLLKTDKLFFIIGLIITILGIGMITWGYMILTNDDLSKMTVFDDVTEPGTKTYVKAQLYNPEFVAQTTDETHVYAIVTDAENKLYLIQSNYKRLEKIYNNTKEDAEYILLKGVAYKTENNIINFTIDRFNELAEEEILDKSNFTEAFTEYYIDVDANYEEGITPIVIGGSISLFGIILAAFGLISKNNSKKTMELEYFPVVEQELNNPIIEFKRAILTNNYIVYNQLGLKVYKYSDLTLMYKKTFTYNGVPSHSLVFYTANDKKQKNIPFGIDGKSVEQIMTYIYDKNNNIMVGYTQENLKKQKELNR